MAGLRREIYNLVPHELKVITLIHRITKLHSNHILSSCTGLDVHYGIFLVVMETNDMFIVTKHNIVIEIHYITAKYSCCPTLFNLAAVGKPNVSNQSNSQSK